MYKIPQELRDVILCALLQEDDWTQNEVDQLVDYVKYLLWKRGRKGSETSKDVE